MSPNVITDNSMTSSAIVASSVAPEINSKRGSPFDVEKASFNEQMREFISLLPEATEELVTEVNRSVDILHLLSSDMLYIEMFASEDEGTAGLDINLPRGVTLALAQEMSRRIFGSDGIEMQEALGGYKQAWFDNEKNAQEYVSWKSEVVNNEPLIEAMLDTFPGLNGVALMELLNDLVLPETIPVGGRGGLLNTHEVIDDKGGNSWKKAFFIGGFTALVAIGAYFAARNSQQNVEPAPSIPMAEPISEDASTGSKPMIPIVPTNTFTPPSTSLPPTATKEPEVCTIPEVESVTEEEVFKHLDENNIPYEVTRADRFNFIDNSNLHTIRIELFKSEDISEEQIVQLFKLLAGGVLNENGSDSPNISITMPNSSSDDAIMGRDNIYRMYNSLLGNNDNPRAVIAGTQGATKFNEIVHGEVLAGFLGETSPISGFSIGHVVGGKLSEGQLASIYDLIRWSLENVSDEINLAGVVGADGAHIKGHKSLQSVLPSSPHVYLSKIVILPIDAIQQINNALQQAIDNNRPFGTNLWLSYHQGIAGAVIDVSGDVIYPASGPDCEPSLENR